METIILIVIGLTAVGYIARMIWKQVNGQSGCQCDGGCGQTCDKDKK